METILAIIFGGAVVAYIYERKRELKAERVQKLLSPKAEELIEISSIRIAERQKDLDRELTEVEKDLIFDECYSRF